MGFNMKGSPAKLGSIQGTTSHTSALKMQAEQNAASALKASEYDAAAKRDEFLGDYVTKRKSLEKKTAGYSDNQYNINKAYYGEEKAKSLQTKYDTKHGITRKAATEVPPSTEAETPKTDTKPKVYSGKFHIDPNAKRKGLGRKQGKTLTNAEKRTEQKKLVTAKKNINLAKGSGDKDTRDLAQLEKAEIRSGRDNAKTGTRLSRFLAKRKVKRNKRQLTKRNTLEPGPKVPKTGTSSIAVGPEDEV